MKVLLKCIVIFLAALSTSFNAAATHIYGADIYYTYVSGTTYTVTLAVYGDCGGSAFPNLVGATPQVMVYNGTTNTQTVNLAAQSPITGVEVTPVCPSQLSNTNCVSSTGTVPGVKRFIYSASLTLGTTSAAWKFQFTGAMGGSNAAGRSTSITNISMPVTGSTMVLEATLNNTTVVNSSPTYTTIPTPFFCINRPANYNPGTVDPNGDSLSYSLVPGLDASGGSVVYLTGYTATTPLAAATGTFSFSTATGQLGFTPNLVQRSLVVYKVNEYRNGILIGTSMREMTFIAVNSCTNNPPIGNISNVAGGTKTDSVSVKVCQSAGTLTFSINPTDADGDVINMVSSGLPAGATLVVTNNNTTAPTGAFSWNVSAIAPGSYTFFITYTDEGCPLSSKQTQAYTITVLPSPGISFALVSAATCLKKAVFTVTSSVSGPWKVKFLQGTAAIDSITSAATTVTDSLAPGTYTMRTFNSNNCFKDTLVTLVSPATTIISVQPDRPTCNKFADGALYVSASNSTAPYQYAIGSGAYTSSGSFTSLAAGNYTVHVRDAMGCVKDSIVALTDSVKVKVSITVTNVLCNSNNTGSITATGSAGSGSPYTYAINAGAPVASGIFTGLLANIYVIRTQDPLGCYIDTSVKLTEPSALLLSHSVTDATCFGSANGSAFEIGAGGVGPYTYNMNGGSYTTSGSFSSLAAGGYIFTVKDANGCIKAGSVTINQPAAIKINSVVPVSANCYGSADGKFTIAASGGVAPYTYAVNTTAFGTNNQVTGLIAGKYVIHVQDANGCTKDTTASISQPSKILSNFNIADPTCATLANGKIVVLPFGGVKPYVYSVDGGKFGDSNTFHPLAAGAHNISIKDSHNCTLDTTLVLVDSLVLRGDFVITDASCFGLKDGAFTITPAGGVHPYFIAIDKGKYSDSLRYASFAANGYTIHIKDSLGCITDTLISISQPDELILVPNITFNACYGLDTVGKVQVTVTGGTMPYKYTWSNDTAAKEDMITGLGNGNYRVLVTDSHLCKDSMVVEVTYDDCCTPYIPNAFTPNGDGKNDDFKILAKGDMKLLEFSVYNRFGQRVFTTDKFGDGWDGIFKGELQDLGTYFYFVKAICGNSGEHTVTLKGDVTLIK